MGNLKFFIGKKILKTINIQAHYYYFMFPLLYESNRKEINKKEVANYKSNLPFCLKLEKT